MSEGGEVCGGFLLFSFGGAHHFFKCFVMCHMLVGWVCKLIFLLCFSCCLFFLNFCQICFISFELIIYVDEKNLKNKKLQQKEKKTHKR